MTTILVTGGAGFIGSNLIFHLLAKYPDYRIINLDKLTYAGSLVNLEGIENSSKYIFVEGDVCDENLVNNLFQKENIKGVIHLAAESHVDNSITGPRSFIDTNIVGTFTLLDAARRYWMDGPSKYRGGYDGCRFHHVSTDEVYGSLGKEGLFTENTPYAPNSPYSASKAGSDMIVRSYFHTYGLNIVITNCSNNYGPKQHDEKLIPTVIRKALAGENIPVYGNGENVRDWLYVADHCSALDLVFHFGELGEVYNIGGDNERTNNYIVNKICEIMDKILPGKTGSYKEQISYVTDRAGHDFRYAIDSSKIINQLKWKPMENFESGIEKTIEWYLKKYSG